MLARYTAPYTLVLVCALCHAAIYLRSTPDSGCLARPPYAPQINPYAIILFPHTTENMLYVRVFYSNMP